MPSSLSRRRFLKNSSIATLGLALSPSSLIFGGPAFDLIIKNATILDGTGGPSWKADLAIKSDHISAIGRFSANQAGRTIDAEGMTVAPGFIDIHTHSDGDILVYPEAESRVMQGITTEVTGNCGYSAAPLNGKDTEERRKEWLEEDNIKADWNNVSDYFEHLEKNKISLNHALLLGQGTLRRNLVGLVDRPLTAGETKQLLHNLAAGLEQGAVGFSSGLEYVPGSFTSTEELISMARVCARYSGLYATHMRDEEAMLLEAIDEAIEIGRRSGVRVQISHLKAAGKSNWHKQHASLALIEDGRESGIDVLADAYPYAAFSTGLTTFIPTWAREGGTDALMERLRVSDTHQRIRTEIDAMVKNALGDYKRIAISRVHSDQNQNLVGKRMSEIADHWRTEPVDALIRLIEEERARVGFVGHGMSEENVEMVLSHPLVMLGSDGSSMAPRGKAARTRPHPRSYGAFARFAGYYVRERRIVDLPTAVKKMTSMPADRIGLHDRGRIAAGKKADLVIFDPEKIIDRATFESPHQYPEGIAHVLVNGIPVVEKGKHSGLRPGQVIRRAS